MHTSDTINYHFLPVFLETSLKILKGFHAIFYMGYFAVEMSSATVLSDPSDISYLFIYSFSF